MLKRLLVLFFGAVLLLGVIAIAPAPANGGRETTDLDGWSYDHSSTPLRLADGWYECAPKDVETYSIGD